MLNYLWAFMILVGIVYALLTGNISAVTDAALDSAGEGISLCITMAGVMALWMGLMEIGQEAGLVQSMTKGLMPFLKYMFPRIPKGHKSLEYIATNMVANILGLGWACTPAGLKAMEALAQLECERGNPEYCEEGGMQSRVTDGNDLLPEASQEGKRQNGRTLKGNAFTSRKERFVGGESTAMKERSASNEMCTFLIVNISSIQLIPVNIIAYRSQYGSIDPAGIVAPAIVATIASALSGVIYCMIKNRYAGKNS